MVFFFLHFVPFLLKPISHNPFPSPLLHSFRRKWCHLLQSSLPFPASFTISFSTYKITSCSYTIQAIFFLCFLFMGTGISGLAPASQRGCSLKPGLGDLPESCISSIFEYLDPPEICKFASLNRAFRGASLADYVWETKLPSNYRYLAHKVLDESSERLGKKEIYARLCRPNRFDGETKEVWLDKKTGKLCLCISAKALKITGIDDRRYWNHIPTEESRFQSVAYLQQIWWFEVVGELEFEFPPGSYSLFFRLQLGKPSKRFGRRVCNLDQSHGWNIKPVRFQLSTSKGQQALSECYLYNPGNWVHYHVGDFVIENPCTPTKIKFSMMQIDCTHTKGGLCVDSVFIYPSEYRERLKDY